MRFRRTTLPNYKNTTSASSTTRLPETPIPNYAIVATAFGLVVLAVLCAAAFMKWEQRKREKKWEAYRTAQISPTALHRKKKRRKTHKGTYAKKQKLELPPEFQDMKRRRHKKLRHGLSYSKEKNSKEGENQDDLMEEQLRFSREKETRVSNERRSKQSAEKISKSRENVKKVKRKKTQPAKKKSIEGTPESIDDLMTAIKENRIKLVTPQEEYGKENKVKSDRDVSPPSY
ncbi:hypothetical protein RB195_004957 [Necator americanus]|uniref:Uncharacterized protein n=1 Tax=Necator americanus TaxID=51031 RepID=A0ABR1BKI5_NECAM